MGKTERQKERRKERQKERKTERREGGNATHPQNFTALIGSKFRRKYMAYAIFIVMQK